MEDREEKVEFKTLAEKKTYYMNVLKSDNEKINLYKQKIQDLQVNIHRIEGVLIILDELEKEQQEKEKANEIPKPTKPKNKVLPKAGNNNA